MTKFLYVHYSGFGENFLKIDIITLPSLIRKISWNAIIDHFVFKQAKKYRTRERRKKKEKLNYYAKWHYCSFFFQIFEDVIGYFTAYKEMRRKQKNNFQVVHSQTVHIDFWITKEKKALFSFFLQKCFSTFYSLLIKPNQLASDNSQLLCL